MQKALNFISGIFLGLGPIIGLGLLGIAIYAGYPSTPGIVIASLPLLAGIWIGYNIFKKVLIVGPIEFMSAKHASSDLDNLIPGDDSKTKLISASEYVNSIKQKTNLFQGGSMRIYGDWFGKPYDNLHKVVGADYDDSLNELIIRFSEGEVLTIVNPKNIFEASTFMKILEADSIKLEFLHATQDQTANNKYYLLYRYMKSKVKAETNVDWYKPSFDTSLGAPAIVIYGQFEK